MGTLIFVPRENHENLSQSRCHGIPKAPGQILVPTCRALLSHGILVPALSRRFLSRFRLSRGVESGYQSRGFAGPGPRSRQIPGQPPIPGLNCGFNSEFWKCVFRIFKASFESWGIRLVDLNFHCITLAQECWGSKRIP